MVPSHLSALMVTLLLALWTALFSGSFQPNPHDMHALLSLILALLVNFFKLFVVKTYWIYDVLIGFLTVCSLGFTALSMVKTKTMSGDLTFTRIFHEPAVSKDSAISAMQRNIGLICTSVICKHFIVYLLSAKNVIGPDMTFILTIATDTCFRLLFTITALDVHVTLFQNIEAELRSEQKSHSRRKAFMKYIFHEMYVL